MRIGFLIYGSFCSRWCYPTEWYGLKTMQHVLNHCRTSCTGKTGWCNGSLWINYDNGNDTMIAEWCNGKEIYLNSNWKEIKF